VIRVERQGVYRVKSGKEEYLVEIVATREGKRYAVIHKTLKGAYQKGDEIHSWELEELDWAKDAEVVDYAELPKDVRAAISGAFPD